jgi:hypothetical protein
MRHAAMIGMGLLLVLGGGDVGGQAPGSGRTDLEKEVDTWLYPKAKVVGSAQSSGRVFQAVLTSDDGLEEVLKYYDKKCGTSLADEDNSPGAFSTRSEFADGKVKSTLAVDDSSVPVPTREKGTPRGVVLRQMTRDEAGFFATVLVTKTKDDAATHLLITYLKK